MQAQDSPQERTDDIVLDGHDGRHISSEIGMTGGPIMHRQGEPASAHGDELFERSDLDAH